MFCRKFYTLDKPDTKIYLIHLMRLHGMLPHNATKSSWQQGASKDPWILRVQAQWFDFGFLLNNLSSASSNFIATMMNYRIMLAYNIGFPYLAARPKATRMRTCGILLMLTEYALNCKPLASNLDFLYSVESNSEDEVGRGCYYLASFQVLGP